MNGLVLLAGERFRRRAEARQPAAGDGGYPLPAEAGRRLDTLDFREAGVAGVAQTFALLAGISRSGITIVAGLARGLNHEDAARFSFLLATPIIPGRRLYKLPDLLGHNGAHIRGQVLAGSAVAAVASYLSVRFLVRYFTSRNLAPFGVYCLVAGVICIARFA